MLLKTFLWLGVFLSTAEFSTTHNISLVRIGNLPNPLYGAACVQDGPDSIFLIGGWGEEWQVDTILHFNLTTEEISQAGTFPVIVTQGTAIRTTSGELFYVGGHTFYNFLEPTQRTPAIWRFEEGLLNAHNLTTIPDQRSDASVVNSESPDALYIIGGQNVDHNYVPLISKFSIETESIEIVAELPEKATGTAAGRVGGAIYIFGGDTGQFFNPDVDLIKYITKFTPEINEVEILDLEFHLGIAHSRAVVVGEEIYIVGGTRKYYDEPEQHHLSKFNPVGPTLETYDLTGFPETGLKWASTVFIPETKRIYVFGGVVDGFGHGESTEIFYIQLE